MSSSCLHFGQRLEELSKQLRQGDSQQTQAWPEVESIAQSLANALRIKDSSVDNHTILGTTSLPQVLRTLLELALHGTIPDTEHALIVFELLRVAANLCMDHDENRANLLEAGLPQAITTLLEDYTKTIPTDLGIKPLPLSIPHLKVIKTSVGVLLNASIGFDPVKFRLISLESTGTIIKLRAAVYPPGAWLHGNEDITTESWELRCGLYDWASRTISELKDVKDESFQILNQSALPFLTPPLLAFCPPFPPQSTSFLADTEIYSNLIETDLEVLEESCMLIESLSLDVEDARLALARGFLFPAEHDGIPCFSSMLDFIEKGDYPPYWSSLGESELRRLSRAFDICKAAVIKAVVEVAGEKGNADVLWDDSEPENPGGAFVCRMVTWIKDYVLQQERESNASGTVGRDDLVICASLSLGNLARRDKHATTLLSPPHSLAPVLTSPHLLSLSTDIKVKHGVIGLLKHLAQYSAQTAIVQVALTSANVVSCLALSGIWDEKTDAMAEVVQAGAIGVVKHLCNSSLENSFALALQSHNTAAPTGLAQILALVKRSDSVPIKSEGTRVLVNLVKSVYTPVPAGSALDDATSRLRQQNRQDCIDAVLTIQCADALAQLIGRSMKYPLLVNEGVVALSLLSNQVKGGPLVLAAILGPLPFDDTPMPLSPSASASVSSGADSPSVATPSTRSRLPLQHRVVDLLVLALKNVDIPAHFPPEIRANICVFLVQLRRHNPPEDLVPVKQATRSVLEGISASQESVGVKAMLVAAARKALDSYTH